MDDTARQRTRSVRTLLARTSTKERPSISGNHRFLKKITSWLGKPPGESDSFHESEIASPAAQAATPKSGEQLQRPSGRCSSCIRLEGIVESDNICKWEHHKNFAALDKSAELGCDMCRLLRWCLLCYPSGRFTSPEIPPFAWSTLMKSTDPVYVYSTVDRAVTLKVSLGNTPPSPMVTSKNEDCSAVGSSRVCSESIIFNSYRLHT